jgi:hypothetical protein
MNTTGRRWPPVCFIVFSIYVFFVCLKLVVQKQYVFHYSRAWRLPKQYVFHHSCARRLQKQSFFHHSRAWRLQEQYLSIRPAFGGIKIDELNVSGWRTATGRRWPPVCFIIFSDVFLKLGARKYYVFHHSRAWRLPKHDFIHHSRAWRLQKHYVFNHSRAWRLPKHDVFHYSRAWRYQN